MKWMKIFYSSIFIVFFSINLYTSNKIDKNIIVNNYSGLTYENNYDEIERLYVDTINIYPKDDNNCDTLLKRYRTWWMTKINNINTDDTTVINIIGDGWRGLKYVVPVYSYNNYDWFRFDDSEIEDHYGAMGKWSFAIKKKFKQKSVYVARTYPYPAERIEKVIAQHKNHPYFKTEILDYSPKGYPIYYFNITNPNIDNKHKKDIWIHSRTHPAETGSSFVLEGMIDYLLGRENMAGNEIDLNKLNFHIVPIVNIDGVICANSRRSPLGYDIEREWRKVDSNKYLLQDDVAKEAKIIYHKITSLKDEGADFIIALNMHSKNAKQFERPFIYSNFTRTLKAHGKQGDILFDKQLHFCKLVSQNFCGDTFMIRRSYEPMKDMAEKIFVESWFWANFKDKVMAGTVEFPESRTYCTESRATVNDYFEMGRALTKGINEYYNFYYTPKKKKQPAHKELLKFYRRPQW
jgi:hypothetical protein